MNFWGYLVLLFIIGCMVEDYQHQEHLNELEKIKALDETKKRTPE